MDRVQPEEELEKLKGTIEEVIFHNDENGYTVLIGRASLCGRGRNAVGYGKVGDSPQLRQTVAY